ncbi:twin-arginine translocase subunit TatC [Desulfovibrio piger]|nr:twin-arginine translocase subunit TatC [Desulfovibrio piger]
MSDKQTLTATEELRPDAEQTAEKDAAQVMADAPAQDTQPAGEAPAETVSETETAPAVADEGPASVTSDEAAPAGPAPSADAATPETEPRLPVSGDGGAQPPAEPPAATGDNEEEDGKPMGLLDHLNELRWRLVRCFIAALVGFCLCWAVVEPLFDILTLPLNNALGAVGAHAQYTSMPEPFFTRMLVAFVAGLFIASPFIFYQIWAFIAPGLYDEEKRFIIPVAVISALFFIGGGLFCYFVVFPYAFNFFIGFSTQSIQITPRISDYLDFILKLLLAFGLIFEMPLFSFFLSRMGVLTAGMMRRGRRYAIVGIFIVAAILTPPDVVSQLLMACPMLVLYECSILVAALCGKKKKNATEEAGDAPAESGDADDTAKPGE